MSTSQRPILRIALVASVLVVASATAYLYYTLGNSDELNAKPEWYVLQMTELLQRGKQATAEGMLVEAGDKNQYRLVGLPSANGNRVVWALLNPKVPPFYKQMPSNEMIRIGPSDIEKIAIYDHVHPDVMARLKAMAR